ncbi:hypothetical protein HAV15_004333 [Penicillium sp. str. |uniref:Uncharacterized protein n=1 Tax=Penicillium solitum TaxID=60172 RepID=A0A1V6QMM6_9EURO|nr:uncharacterized protein PENSOL_c060G03754 [Penicillium solitum]KAF4771601.1 hypothetical protein HAV15_004333 [Penicillium sp. str. \
MNSDKKEVVVTDKSPLPLKPSPYSAAVKHGGLVFCSGNIGMDPVSEKLVEGDVGDRTRQSLRNVSAVLEAAGTSIQNVIRSHVYLTSMDDFAAMNKAYLEFFRDYVPARTCVAVKALPLGTDVEIECTAHM